MRILIIGVGAIGSNLVKSLVPDLKGNHEITVLDKDKVEERNVTAGTQFYTADQIGLSKVEALQFNVFKAYEREIKIRQGEVWDKIGAWHPGEYDLVIDCLDNSKARAGVQNGWQIFTNFELLHIGFSDQFTFAIEWAENYKVPSDIISGMDICTMPGAAAFANIVGSMGALVVEKFIDENKKIEILGGKYEHRIVK